MLIGSSGSGKSTFAAKHFLSTEVISSDYCRALVSNSETDQGVAGDALDLVREIAGRRLKHRKVAVIDATNVRPADRKAWIELARRWHALPVAIVLDPGIDVCIERNKAGLQPDHFPLTNPKGGWQHPCEQGDASIIWGRGVVIGRGGGRITRRGDGCTWSRWSKTVVSS